MLKRKKKLGRLLNNCKAQTDNCSTSCGEIQNIKEIHLAAKILTTSFLAYVNRQTILEIFRGKYHVHNILYDDQILRLVDVNFAIGSCSLSSGTVETGDGNVKDFQFQGAVIYHISRFRFVKSFKNISGLPAAAKYTRVPCLAATNGSYFSAVCVPEYIIVINRHARLLQWLL
ncbi:hypothetical protein DVH24_007474 [Malus domestica]|uniref:Protein kinase domain-containing protein n=1 Tax=Malus domestica TaxID=3750 RepID=A0A498HFG5_MALDO|nr:hypothetical protein DVH24_007474 [Malus domestica]